MNPDFMKLKEFKFVPPIIKRSRKTKELFDICNKLDYCEKCGGEYRHFSGYHHKDSCSSKEN